MFKTTLTALGLLLASSALSSSPCGNEAKSTFCIDANFGTQPHYIQLQINQLTMPPSCWGGFGRVDLPLSSAETDELLEEELLELGANQISFYQCSDRHCSERHVLSDYRFTLSRLDETYQATPEHAQFSVEEGFGECDFAAMSLPRSIFHKP